MNHECSGCGLRECNGRCFLECEADYPEEEDVRLTEEVQGDPFLKRRAA